jgi:hypothetical protein
MEQKTTNEPNEPTEWDRMHTSFWRDVVWPFLTKQRDQKETRWWILGIALVLLAFVGIISPTRDSSPAESRTNRPTSANDEESASHKAFLIAKRFITDQLKAPSSAEFSGTIFPEYRYSKLPDGSWRISSWVDAQNGFGAKLRKNWVCELRQTGSDWADPGNWRRTGFCGLIE